MPWIESHSVLVEHRKVREAARELSITPVTFLGHLHCLWHRVIDLCEDGDITSWTEHDIAYYSRWEGDEKIFYSALKNRFIDEKRGMKLIHDWLDYAGRYLTTKYRNSNPKRLKEIEKKHNTKGRTKGSPKGCVEDGQPTVPKEPTKPDQPNLTDKGGVDEIKYTEFVSLSSSEYQKLVDEHGEALTKRMIETLSNYKGAHGKRYKSDYRAILSWVVDKVKGAPNGTSKHTGLAEKDYSAGAWDLPET